MPPSAITGTPAGSATLTAFMTADTWGTPTPLTIRVVQIAPGPMPTFTPSTPASIRSLAPAAVATLPAITWMSHCRLISRTVSITLRLCPWAVSTTTTSTPAAMTASTRLKSFTPVAAPTRSRPRRSLQLCGNSFILSMSRIVISPARRPSPSVSSSFSTLAR